MSHLRTARWFELRLGELAADDSLVAAPVAERRSALARDVVFARPLAVPLGGETEKLSGGSRQNAS
jgi:hypothetical protein